MSLERITVRKTADSIKYYKDDSRILSINSDGTLQIGNANDGTGTLRLNGTSLEMFNGAMYVPIGSSGGGTVTAFDFKEGVSALSNYASASPLSFLPLVTTVSATKMSIGNLINSLVYPAIVSGITRNNHLSRRLTDSVSLFDYIPENEHAAIINGTSTYDCSSDVKAALATGKNVYVPPGKYRLLQTVIVQDVDVSIYGPGTFIVDVDKTAFKFRNNLVDQRIISSLISANWVGPNTVTTKCEITGTNPFVHGDVMFLTSEDEYPYFMFDESKPKQAEIFPIAGVSGNTLYFNGRPRRPYTTSARLYRIPRRHLDVQLNVEGASNPYTVPLNSPPLPEDSIFGVVSFLGWIDGRADVRVTNSLMRSVPIFSCYRGFYDIHAQNIRDNVSAEDDTVSANWVGYGAAVMGASKELEVKVDCRRTRHAFTTTMSTNEDLYSRGEQMNIIATGQASECHIAFDTHTGAVNPIFRGCIAINDRPDVDTDSIPASFQTRALNPTFIDCMAIRDKIQGHFMQITRDNDYGENNTIKFVNCNARLLPAHDRAQIYTQSLYAHGSSTFTTTVQFIGGSYTGRLVVPTSSNAMVVSSRPGTINLEFHNVLLESDDIQIQENRNVKFINCTRSVTSFTSSKMMDLRNGADVTLVNMTFDGNPTMVSGVTADASGKFYVRLVGSNTSATLRFTPCNIVYPVTATPIFAGRSSNTSIINLVDMRNAVFSISGSANNYISL